MADLTLYYSIPSRGLVTHWMLEEVGVPFERRVLDLQAGDGRKPEILALNPVGRVPILVHGDRVITETTATCLYLAEQFPEAGLNVAVDSPLRGELLRWLFFNPGTLELAIFGATVGFKVDEAVYKPAATAAEVAEVLRDALRGREFLVGDQFSVADVVIGSGINWGLNMMGVFPGHAELVDYWARLEARPAWQRVAATMAA